MPDLSEIFLFKQLSAQSCKKSSKSIIDSYVFHPERGSREKEILRKTFSDASVGNTIITDVRDSSKKCKGSLGLVSLSAGKITLDKVDFPVIVIDFLFVDHRHRNIIHDHLGVKVSEMLLYYAIQTALKVSKEVGVRYLILHPDGGKKSKNLVKFYESIKFKYMTPNHEWMFLKLH